MLLTPQFKKKEKALHKDRGKYAHPKVNPWDRNTFHRYVDCVYEDGWWLGQYDRIIAELRKFERLPRREGSLMVSAKTCC